MTPHAQNIPADAQLFLEVDRNPNVQRMRIYRRNESGQMALIHTWPVSTGSMTASSNWSNPNFNVSCRETPVSPQGQDLFIDAAEWRRPEIWNSTIYSGARMHRPLFFGNGTAGAPSPYRAPRSSGFAVHGVDANYYERLGSIASGGCVRITSENSAVLDRYVDELLAANAVGANDQTPAIRVRVIDSSTAEEQAQLQNRCTQGERVNECIQRNLRPYYNSVNGVETEEERAIRLTAEAQPHHAAPAGEDRQRITTQVGDPLPEFSTAQEALDWLNNRPSNPGPNNEGALHQPAFSRGSFPYQVRNYYDVANGVRAESPERRIRVHQVPPVLIEHFRAQCSDSSTPTVRPQPRPGSVPASTDDIEWAVPDEVFRTPSPRNAERFEPPVEDDGPCAGDARYFNLDCRE